MKRLNAASLKAGDVILTTTAAKISKTVRFGTGSDISHAMVYVEDHSVIHATGDGVQARNTQHLLFEDDSPVPAGTRGGARRCVCMHRSETATGDGAPGGERP